MAWASVLQTGEDGMEWRRPGLRLTSVFLVSLLFAGCSTPVQIEPVQLQEVSSYRLTTKRAGFAAAVDPYFETARLKTHFGTDLLARGILPVLVVFRNYDAPGGFVLLPDLCMLVCGDTEAHIDQGDFLGVEEKRKDLRGAEVALGLSMMLFPITGLFTLPALASGEDEYLDAVEIVENMDKLALTPRPVYRGDSDSGFLFFRLENPDVVHRITAAWLIAENVRTNKRVMFILPFKPQ